MSFSKITTERLRGLWGTGFGSWILLTACLIVPEWTREDDDKHCGVFFCCSAYVNCTVTDTEVVSDPLPWILSSWMLNFVGICSALCRCSSVHPENVRHMAIMNIISGVFCITGTAQFIVQKYTSVFADINFGACGIFAHIAGWMLFISGCCGFCHGYGYDSSEYDDEHRPKPRRSTPGGNEIYPVTEDEMEMASTPYRNGPPPGGSSSRLSRLRDNVFPANFARRFWRDTISLNRSLDSQPSQDEESTK
uniref:uncharacterized protein LOC120341531 n=1 Tax=Styela clava TaxID=7725 RepID=UPI001939C959|nr:uncharacterized protein LOC120341531 [Styela clava]